MRAVQVTRFGSPEILEVVDVLEPVPGDGQQLYDVSTAGVNYADTNPLPADSAQRSPNRFIRRRPSRLSLSPSRSWRNSPSR
jgi:NADPH:quinone reductase-like Zn-dependent oxidoreductase